ncbi:MAG TPA: hypothetical protein VGL47_08165 [Amycolatopsis sp.]|uniref:SPW repeat-containing integral membrane domain-containing protein n=1 Tax=Amycolatopsis nalaikhensis TaxID=715472 RepID=A0ABY8XL31_9PSEU|nr:hypothetical protein [Amycolatopsis sp. 2-2]WIV56347.1 hypothetical protein QP939_47405 [Amycolatopsis sp. 2-2]
MRTRTLPRTSHGVAAPSLALAVVNALTFLTGLWLALSPSQLDQELSGGGFNGFWNDVLVGAVVLLCGAAQLVAPSSAHRWRPVLPIAGTWLIVAPIVLGYNHGTPAPATTTGDVAAGAVILALWVIGVTVLGRALRARDER